MSQALLVCWSRPDGKSAHAVVLSFLPPAAEDDFEKTGSTRVIRAREVSQSVREEARRLYIHLTTRIGLAPCADGSTLRKALSRPGESSLWWYHPVSFRDPEGDPALEWIIAVLTVAHVARKEKRDRLILHGAPREVCEVLKSVFAVTAHDTQPYAGGRASWLRAVASRTKTAFMALMARKAAKIYAATFEKRFDVLLSGFWDWSVCWDEKTSALTDRYFKRLPDELRGQGFSKVGWLAWLDPEGLPGRGPWTLSAVLAPLSRRRDVVILQSFLNRRDILRIVADARPLLTYLKLRRRRQFREIFIRDGRDYYPLFSKSLLRGFLGASIPRFDLVALSTARAARLLRPQATVSFLEHFPHARAHYEGVGRSIEAVRAATQHASYCHEKTFYFLDPKLEFRGEPDGCPAPHPDHVFAMGSLGRELFLECGYSGDRVSLSGSPRYDHIRMGGPTGPARPERRDKTTVLILASLDIDLEVEMAEAAWAAAGELKDVRLICREHPFGRLSGHPRFHPLKSSIEISKGTTLAEDIARADILLFTYSTTAEEAILEGKPVWQWLPLKFNGSALAEAAAIPQFSSVAALRKAFMSFSADPSRYEPPLETRRLVLERLFFRGDGGAAARISVALKKILRPSPRART